MLEELKTINSIIFLKKNVNLYQLILILFLFYTKKVWTIYKKIILIIKKFLVYALESDYKI